MSLRYLIKLAKGMPSRVQQSPFAQQIAAQHGVEPYALQNDTGTALQQLTAFVQGNRQPIQNPYFAYMTPSEEAPKKTQKKVEPAPVLSPYEQGIGYTGAFDSFAKQHRLHPEEDTNRKQGAGSRVLSLHKNKDFTKLTKGPSSGRGNPTSKATQW